MTTTAIITQASRPRQYVLVCATEPGAENPNETAISVFGLSVRDAIRAQQSGIMFISSNALGGNERAAVEAWETAQ